MATRWGTSSWSDPALVVGQSVYDPDSGVTITPVAVSSTGAAVSVSFGPLACVRANPTVALSPSQSQWVSAGTTVTYTVTVMNNDNAGCPASSFSLQAALPNGWTASFANPGLAIGPGASGSTTLQVTSPAAAPDGFYTIGVMATNTAEPTYNASTVATHVIISSLDVAVSSDQPSYAPNQTVTLTASVPAPPRSR